MLFEIGYKNNAYFWHHYLLAYIGIDYLLEKGFSDMWSFIFIILLAVAFEYFQRFVLKGHLKHGIPVRLRSSKNIGYGTEKELSWRKGIFWLDSIGDIVAAILGGLSYILRITWNI